MTSPETQNNRVDTLSELAQVHKTIDTPEVMGILRGLHKSSESYSREMLDLAIENALKLKDSPEAVAGAFLWFAEKVQKERQKAIDGALRELLADLDFHQNKPAA